MEAPVALDIHLLYLALLPITLVVFLQTLIRRNLAILLKSPETQIPTQKQRITYASPKLRATLTHRANVQRMRLLMKNSFMLTEEAYNMRKTFFLEDLAIEGFDESKTSESDSILDQQPDLDQLNTMVHSMKQSTVGMLPNMLSVAWVSYFFSGVVILRLPFPVFDVFKAMLQRGIHFESLDSSYVSSLSWYFLSLFGLKGLFSIIFPKEIAPKVEFGVPTGVIFTQNSDLYKIVRAQKEELEIHHFEEALAGSEERICQSADKCL